MALFGRKKSKIDDKEIKDVINKNIASSLRTQPSFSEILKLNGCPTIKLGSIGSKIRKQLLNEAKNGDLTVETVMPRSYELIGEFLGISEVKTFQNISIENNKPKYCGNCGNPIVEDSKFCPNCGSKLITDLIKCSKCGEINEPSSKFCVNCGNNLKEINNPTREEFEQQAEKIKEKLNSKDLITISIGDKTIGNHKIEKDNPNLGNRDVKFKTIDYGVDIGQDLSDKIDDTIIEKYGTRQEKAEMAKRHQQKSIKNQKKHNLYEKYHEASDLYFNHDYEKAIKLFREIIDNGEIYDESVSLAYTDLKWCYEALHDYDSAISIINEHIEVKKEFDLDYSDLEKDIDKIKKSERKYKAKGLREKGLKLFYSGKNDEAIPFFKECIDLSDDDSKTYDRLTDIYIAKRDFKTAKEVLEKGIGNVTWEYALQNENKTGLKDRLENIDHYLETGELTGEKMPFESESRKYEIRNAKQILKEEDKDKGIEMLENIIEEGTYSNTVYYTLYQTYKKDKKYDDCIRVCDKAIESLGLFSRDRLLKWTEYKDKIIVKRDKELSK